MCSVEDVIAPVVDTITAVFAPELLPIEAPLVGAATGELTGGTKGAIEGGLEGFIGGQLGGTGELAPFSTDAAAGAGGTDFLGLSTGGTSVIGGALNDAGSALGLSGDTATAAPGTAGGVATTGEGGAPTFSPSAATSAAAPAGGFTAPVDANNLGLQGINTALSQDTLAGNSLSATGGTDLGSISTPATAPTASIQTADIGPIGSGAPDLSSNLGAINGGGTSGLAPSVSTGTPSAADTAFLNGSTASTGAANIGQGPTIAAAADLAAPPPVNDTSAVGQALQGNFGQAGADVGSFLSNPKNLPTVLGAGYVGLEELQGPPGLTAAEKNLQYQGNALTAEGQAGLAQANAGTISPAQTATISEYVQNATNQLYQQLASSGVTNPQGDSRYIQGMQQIQQQAQTMTAAYVQQNFTNAMSEMGSAANDLSNVANAQSQADSAFTTAMSSAIGSVGTLAAVTNLKGA